MTRRYGDPVVVRCADGVDGDASDGPQLRPEAFLWRERVYVVREVLGHWHERQAWWTGPAAKALHGEVDAAPATAKVSASTATLQVEREVWRVEASRGRMFGSGVYDLCRDAPSAQEWRLVHVSD
jgi:hypothetical protein